MNWKHVFDGTKGIERGFRDRDKAERLALEAGYNFLAFNGRIYFAACVGGIDSRIDWQDTGLRVKDGEIV